MTPRYLNRYSTAICASKNLPVAHSPVRRFSAHPPNEHKMNKNLFSLIVSIAALIVTPSAAPAAIIFESAQPGGGGQSGITIGGASHQIYGAAFSISTGVHVDSIGGLINPSGAPFTNDIFGALVRLTSVDALPTGNPFTGPEVVASVVFNAGSDAPLSVDLDPGAYAVVFGNDQFGATGTAVAPPAGTVLTTHYLVWNTNAGSWGGGTGYSRFYVTGTVVPEPSSALLLLSGAALCLRRRTLRTT